MPEVEYISYNVGTRDLPDIYARALGLGHIYQANPLCPCYNYYIYIYIYIYMLNKNSLAVKKCEANQKAQWL